MTALEMLTSASAKIDRLVSFSEDVIGDVAESGIETEDTPLIRHCIAKAGDMAKSPRSVEQAIRCGAMSLSDLFDENYTPIPGSDPLQHMTRLFTQHTPTGCCRRSRRRCWISIRASPSARRSTATATCPPTITSTRKPQSADPCLERGQLPQPPHLQRSHRARRGP
jgi:hypothetical protein